MQFKTLLIVLLAFLIQNMQSLKKRIVWIYVAIASFGIWYFAFRNTWSYFCYARGAVWLKTLELALKHPITGWGIGTYKWIFPTLARGAFEFEGIWENAHNEFLEAFSEIGFVGMIPLVLYIGYLLEIKIHRKSRWQLRITKECKGLALLGSLMVFFTLCFYFPMHQPHTSLLLVAFVAYRERQIREKILWPANLT